jgi:uncharacterized membrane protein YbhN (UPF0104 family)
MESSESFEHLGRAATPAADRSRVALIKAAIGFVILGALLYWGQIDLKALAALADAPATVLLCILLVYVMLPIAALRWGILLRSFRISISFRELYHFVGIATLFSLILLGSIGGDAVRMLYAWRRVGHGSGRIAISILADRLLGLFALLFILVLLSLLNWSTIRQVPPLAALASSVFLVFAAGVVGAGSILAAPRLAYRLGMRLSRWPRLAKLARQIHDVIVMGRRNPARLAAAFALALIIQTCTVLVVVLIAQVMGIGVLMPIDFAFATPLTLMANTLPLTPNGLGVGEVAFEQICRWLEPVRSGAAYSSIFFAFRAVAALVSLSGIVSWGLYRRPLPAIPQ